MLYFAVLGCTVYDFTFSCEFRIRFDCWERISGLVVLCSIQYLARFGNITSICNNGSTSTNTNNNTSTASASISTSSNTSTSSSTSNNTNM